jgi:hypothetical protein
VASDDDSFAALPPRRGSTADAFLLPRLGFLASPARFRLVHLTGQMWTRETAVQDLRQPLPYWTQQRGLIPVGWSATAAKPDPQRKISGGRFRRSGLQSAADEVGDARGVFGGIARAPGQHPSPRIRSRNCGSRSTISTRAPFLARVLARLEPASPPPMMAASKSMLYSLAARGHTGRRRKTAATPPMSASAADTAMLGNVEIAVLVAGDVVGAAHAGPLPEVVALGREDLDALR